MAKQLYNVSDEALQDLNDIFDAVMVNKVLDNSDKNHETLKQQLNKVNNDLKWQLEYLEKINPIVEVLGKIPKTIDNEFDNPEEFQDKTGKLTISSVLIGTSLANQENIQKIKVLEKNIGSYPLKDAEGNILTKSLTELLQTQYTHEISTLKEIRELIKNHSNTTKKFHSNHQKSIEEQMEVSKRNRLDFDVILNKELVQMKNRFEQEVKLNQEKWQSVESMNAKNSKVSLALSIIMIISIIISIALQLTYVL